MADPCCVEARTFTAEAETCEVLACDPTLEACCQRDLEQQAMAARLKAQLSIHDRSKERLRMAGQVLGAALQVPTDDSAAHPGSNLESDADDEDLDHLQAQRRQQLQRQAQRKASMQYQGHGSLTDVPELRLLREAKAAGPAPLVCHLAFEGSPFDDELNEHLARLAHQHLGTRFVRTLISLCSTLHLKLRTPPGPGLLCFRGGSLVGAAGLNRFGAPECILEETVDNWLRQLKMLRLMPCGGDSGAGSTDNKQNRGGLQDACSGGSSSEGEEQRDDWQQACEVCGRRYPHQHIRSVHATRGSGSDSD